MKRKADAIFIIIPAVIVGLIIFNIFFHIRTLSSPLTSDAQILNAVVDAALDGKRTLKFKSTIVPSEEVIDQVFEETFKRDKYVGAEIHHYSYTYIPSGAYYRVKVKISKPSFLASFFTRIRVKQIALHLSGLDSDYAKVKAAHDYLIRLNKYNYIKGGAFSCLYGRESACNGYAYSFYLIMTELGIPVTCDFGRNHVWNRVMLDGYWYNIDVTFDDTGSPNGYYGYFLKCNDDWNNHDYGLSDAPSSLPVTGLSAGENYRRVPNYRLIGLSIGAVLAVGLFFLLKFIRKKWNERELKRIQKELELQEKARQLFEEQLQKKRDEFAKEDHNLY
ncbi:MAG: hypothetical protein IKO32_07325 [Lachnospiraceae bacterium]|nr:hypothetical protein [Lachnospiraceae bacterium]